MEVSCGGEPYWQWINPPSLFKPSDESSLVTDFSTQLPETTHDPGEFRAKLLPDF